MAVFALACRSPGLPVRLVPAADEGQEQCCSLVWNFRAENVVKEHRNEKRADLLLSVRLWAKNGGQVCTKYEIKQISMDNNRNGGSMDKDGHITDFRNALAGRSDLEALRWRLVLALTLIVLCCLIGVVIGVCEL